MTEESNKLKSDVVIPEELVDKKILVIRGYKVILDTDLAELYGVSTKRFNEQVKRNIERFPEDFMFQLSKDEKNEVVAICDHLTSLKFSYHLPYAFTEHGIAMLSAILKSDRAVKMSIFIVRAFIKMRELLVTDKDFAQRMEIIERKQKEQGDLLVSVYSIVKKIIDEPIKKKNRIGFVENSK